MTSTTTQPQFGDTLPLPSGRTAEFEPQAGMLVESGGHWYLAEDFCHHYMYGAPPKGPGSPYFTLAGSNHDFHLSECVPLLPSAAQLAPGSKAWPDALHVLAQLPGASEPGRIAVGILTEDGNLSAWFEDGDYACNYTPFPALITKDRYDAHMRDVQKFGALRQWLQTVAARAQEGE